MTRLVRGVLAAALLVLLGTVPVYAHSDLEASDPADGATISTPYTLTATFSEEFDAERSFIRIVDSSGTRVAEGGLSADDPLKMLVELPSLGSGSYTARWQTVTPDDNGIERGEFAFTVAQPAANTDAGFTNLPSAPPTTSAAAPTRPATAGPTPTASAGGGGSPTSSGTDIVLALVLAAAVLIGLGAYLYLRSRR